MNLLKIKGATFQVSEDILREASEIKPEMMLSLEAALRWAVDDAVRGAAFGSTHFGDCMNYRYEPEPGYCPDGMKRAEPVAPPVTVQRPALPAP